MEVVCKLFFFIEGLNMNFMEKPELYQEYDPSQSAFHNQKENSILSFNVLEKNPNYIFN